MWRPEVGRGRACVGARLKDHIYACPSFVYGALGGVIRRRLDSAF